MALVYLGSLSIGACLPAPTAALATAFTDLEARVEAMLEFSPVPIDFSAQLTIAAQIVADLNLAISIGLPAPSISAQIAIMAALMASLEAQLSLILALQNALGVAGVFAYAYSGTAAGLGPSLPAAFPGGTGSDATNALVLATTTPATWAAMQLVFRTTP